MLALWFHKNQIITQRFGIPFCTAALNPLPIVVELVIGNAPDPWQILVSTHTTASAPSQVTGIPGYWNFCSDSSEAGV